MTEFYFPGLSPDDWSIDSNNDSDDRELWAVTIRPPEEYDDSPQAAAERLFSHLHGEGTISAEIHSDGPNVEFKIVVQDRPTARAVARQARAELGAVAEIDPATMPVDSSDAIAAATFELEKDSIYPPTTARTDDGDIGPLRHVLDTLGEEDVRGCYQLVAEPIESDGEHWTTRRSRAWPESIRRERDMEAEGKRAGAAIVGVASLSVVLSPWPLATSVMIGLALIVAASVGEGVRIPQRRTAEDIANETHEQAKEAHGAQSTKAKRAKEAANVIAEQGDAPGWRLAVRLVVGDDNGAAARDHVARLANQVEKAFSSNVTGQALDATITSGREAHKTLADIRARKPNQTTRSELLHQLLAHGTRRSMRGGSFVLSSFAYLAGENGGGSDAREFVDESDDIDTMDVPDAAPTYARTPAIADGGTIDENEFHVDHDDTETRTHPEYGEVEVQIIERRPDKDQDDHYAGEFTREWVESSQHDSLIWVGYSEDDGQIREIGVPISQLRRPAFIAGASGAGKSTLAEVIALQHIWGGRGCAIVDPHNDFVDELETKIPEHRRDDVIEIDPADLESEYTHTINFLDVEVDEDHPDYTQAVNEAIEDAIGVISQGASNIGDRMEDVLHGVTRGMIVSEKDYTFLDMRDVLRYEDDREEFALQMAHEGRKYLAQFAHDLSEMSNDDLAPVNRLLNKWILSPTAREIVNHSDTSINFRQAIEEDKIILVRNDLSDGIRELFATAIFSKIWRAARQRPRGERPMYPILMDEIDDIHTPEMGLGAKLGNARKYGIGLTLMTQKPLELDDITEDIKTNCKLFVAFACPSDKQARPVANMFDCEKSRVTQLGDYRALVQLDIDGTRKGPITSEMLAPVPSMLTEDEVDQEISIPSRRNYGIRRDRVSDAPDELDEDDEDNDEIDPMDEFMEIVANAADNGDLNEDEQYTFVHKDKPNERLRVNPSRVIEQLDNDDLRAAEEYTSLSKERVDDEASYVTGHRVRDQDISRGLGVSMSALTDALTGVDRGKFE